MQDFNAQMKKSGQIRDKKEVGTNDALSLGNIASFQWQTGYSGHGYFDVG